MERRLQEDIQMDETGTGVRMKSERGRGGVVLVHCEHGVSRGASSVLAYLIAHHVSRHDIAAVWVAFFSR